MAEPVAKMQRDAVLTARLLEHCEGPAVELDMSLVVVVCANFHGSVYGLTSLLDVMDAASGCRTAAAFPVATVRDNTRACTACCRRCSSA